LIYNHRTEPRHNSWNARSSKNNFLNYLREVYINWVV